MEIQINEGLLSIIAAISSNTHRYYLEVLWTKNIVPHIERRWRNVGAKSLALIKETGFIYEYEGEVLQKEAFTKLDMPP